MDGAAIHSNARLRTERGWTVVTFAFAACAVLAGVLTWPTAPDMVRTWIGDSTYHHGAFVAPAALWMILAHSRSPKADAPSTTGLLIVLAGALLWLIGRAGGASIVEQVAFVTVLIGFVGAVFGDDSLGAWAWPLGFLFFLVPAGDSLLPALQFATAEIVVGALRLIGLEIAVDGIVIQTRVGAFAIAEACAGLNLLIAAIMLSAVFAYLSFENWPRRIAFIMFAAVFAIIANAVRAFFLILIPVLRGEQAGIGPDHYLIGWALYAVVLLALAFVGRRFANRQADRATETPQPKFRIAPFVFAAGILATGAIYAAKVIDRPVERAAPATLSLLNAPGWRILPPPEAWPSSSSHADRSAAATYTSSDTQVFVALSYFTHDRRGAEIAGAGRTGTDSGLRRTGDHAAVLYLFGGAEEQKFQLLRGDRGEKLAALTVYWLGPDLYPNARAVKLAQAKLKLRGQNPQGGAITLAAPYTDNPEEAVRAIGRFTGDVEDITRWRARLAGK